VQLSLIFLVLLLLLGILHVATARRAFEMRQVEIDQRVNRGLAADMAREIEPYLAEGQQPEEVGSVIHYMMVLNPAVEIYVLDTDGRILAFFAEGGAELQTKEVDTGALEAFLAGEPLPIYGDDPRRPGERRHFSAARLSLGSEETGYLYIVLRSSRYLTARAELESSFLFEALRDSVVFTVPLVAALGLLVFFALTRRLQRLTAAVRSFGQGSYSPRAAVSGRDEIGELALSFNEMADTIESNLAEIERADRERREFVASISHDLRNPLASIRGYTETLLEKDDELSVEERKRYLRISLDRAASLSRLIDDLFELSKLDSPNAEPRSERFSLAELVHDVSMQMQPAATAREVTLVAREPADLFMVEADVRLIERTLANLIENALRHTPRGGTVEVGIRRTEIGTRVSVADTGGGVPEDERERIFERFYIGDGSRARAREGSGLGLAIAKRVVELHHGAIGLESSSSSGSIFFFELPTKEGATHEQETHDAKR
jgi:signal transduction histidine kinase